MLIYSDQLSIYGKREVVGAEHRGGLFLKEISRDIANGIIRANHYSGKIVNNTYIHLGVFFGGRLLGALQFGYALQPNSGGNIVPGTKNDEYLELNRMWVDDLLPRNTESVCISIAISYIKNKYPQVRFIQSFADERCGGLGVVYQAANFLYYGKHDTTFYEYEGQIYHPVQLAKSRPLARKGVKPKDCAPHSFSQYRYIFWVKPKYKSKCTLTAQPYPKPA